jgi:hypothetical protein
MSRQTVTAQLPCRSLSRQPRKLKAASFGHLMGQERLFSWVQKRAQELVEEIAALPPPPKQIYEMGDAASGLAKHREHRSTWGVLTSTNQDFLLTRDVGNVYRDAIGEGFARMPDGAPRIAFIFRN